MVLILLVKVQSQVFTAKCRIEMCNDLGVESYTEAVDCEGCKYIVFIINEYQAYIENQLNGRWFNNTIAYLLRLAERTGIYLILASQCNQNSLLDDVVKMFPIRITTPISEEISNLYIGNNSAAMEQLKYGVVLVKEDPQRLLVPFYPDTWIRKFAGYSSVRKKFEVT